MSEADEAMELIWREYNRAGKLSRKDCEEFLEQSARFRNCDNLEGARSPDANKRILNLLWTVAGDAFLKLRVPAKAADAYFLASQLHKPALFGPNYARVVLRHRMTGHYEAARAALERFCSSMTGYTFKFRLFCHWMVIRRSPRAYLGYLAQELLIARRLRMLDKRIEQMRQEIQL